MNFKINLHQRLIILKIVSITCLSKCSLAFLIQKMVSEGLALAFLRFCLANYGAFNQYLFSSCLSYEVGYSFLPNFSP